MTVNLIHSRFIQLSRFFRIGSRDVLAFHHPDAHTFHAAGVYIPRILNGHLCIGSVQAAHMLVVEALLASDEYFSEGPFIHRGFLFGSAGGFAVAVISVS